MGNAAGDTQNGIMVHNQALSTSDMPVSAPRYTCRTIHGAIPCVSPVRMPGCAPRVHTELAPMDTEASTPSARNLPMGRFPGFHPHFVTTRTSPSVGSAADTSGTAPLWRASGAPPSHYRRSGTGPRRRRISIEGFGSPMGVRPLRGDRRAVQAAVTMPVWGQRSSPWPHPPRGFRSPACRRTALLAARGRW